MKVLVVLGVIAAALAAPVPDGDGRVVVAHHAAVSPLTYGAAVAPAGTLGFSPIAHGVATGFAPGPLTYTAAVAPVDDGDKVVVAHHGAVAPLTYGAAVAPAGISQIAHGVATAFAPGPVTYAAAPAAVAPVATTYAAAPAAVAPVAATYAAAPAAVAPVAATYAAVPQVHSVAHPVALPAKEVKVPVTTTQVEVPVHQKVHYGTQAYVAGATTTIHKPALAAPAISPPATLLSKTQVNAPEVTLKTQEIPVEKHTPNFVETPYHAGTIVKYSAPEIKEVKVPTPVAQPVPVPHPVPVAAPYAVPQAVPVPQEVHSVAVHQPVVHPVAIQQQVVSQPLNYIQHGAFPAAFTTVVEAED